MPGKEEDRTPREAGDRREPSTTKDGESGTDQEVADPEDCREEPGEADKVWMEDWWCPPEVAGKPPQLWRAAAERVSGE